jgi:hypothetical protein
MSQWQDRYIRQDPDGFGYICYNHRGEFIALVESLEEAREIIEEYSIEGHY